MDLIRGCQTSSGTNHNYTSDCFNKQCITFVKPIIILTAPRTVPPMLPPYKSPSRTIDTKMTGDENEMTPAEVCTPIYIQTHTTRVKYCPVHAYITYQYTLYSHYVKIKTKTSICHFMYVLGLYY